MNIKQTVLDILRFSTRKQAGEKQADHEMEEEEVPIDPSDNRIGAKMIAAGVISESQRDALLRKQQKLRDAHIYMRFGDIAIQEGYCTRGQVEDVMHEAEERINKGGW